MVDMDASNTKGKRSRRHRLRPLISISTSHSSSSSASASADSRNHHASFNSSTEEEDHDLANCLILLAQGPNPPAAFFVYECKTCNKTFPSFQALGGHRASHKKPKLDDNKDKKPHFRITPQIHFPTPKPKLHECSICGSEFTSGQALGGHMRRHRSSSSAAVIKPRNVLQLDLNLPPPEHHLRTYLEAFL